MQEDECFSKGGGRKPVRGDHIGQVVKVFSDKECKREQEEGGEQISTRPLESHLEML